jgi:hypothetical protein
MLSMRTMTLDYKVRVPTMILFNGCLLVASLSHNFLEMTQETFDTMWALSASGGETEDCFLRVNHTGCFPEQLKRPNPLEAMPDVSVNVFDRMLGIISQLLKHSFVTCLSMSVFRGQCVECHLRRLPSTHPTTSNTSLQGSSGEAERLFEVLFNTSTKSSKVVRPFSPLLVPQEG